MDKVKEEKREQKELKSNFASLRNGNIKHNCSSLVLHCQGTECTDGMSVATTKNDVACDENIQPSVTMNGEFFNNNVCFVDLSLVEQDSETLRSTHKNCCSKSCTKENVQKEESHKIDRECKSCSNIEINGHRNVICIVTEEEVHSQTVICTECQKLQESLAEDKQGTKHKNSYDFTSSCNEIGIILNSRLDPVIDSIPVMNGDFSGEDYDPTIQYSEPQHNHTVIQNSHDSKALTRGHDAVLPLEDKVDSLSNSDSDSGDGSSKSAGASDLTCSRKLDCISSGQQVVRPKTGPWHQQSSQKSCKSLRNHQNLTLNGHTSLTWERASDSCDENKLVDPIQNSLDIQDCLYGRLDSSVPDARVVGRSLEHSVRPLVVPYEQRARCTKSCPCSLDFKKCDLALTSAHQSLVLSLNRNWPNHCTCSMCTYSFTHCNSSVVSDSQIVTENKDSSSLAPLALPERDIDSDSDNSCDMCMVSEEHSPLLLSVSENTSYLPCEGTQSSQNDNTVEGSGDNDLQRKEDLQNQAIQSDQSEAISENVAEVQYAYETTNSISSSLESIEDVGDYIETDFPSANRFAMSGDSSSTSSVEEDEGCGSDVAPANNEESDNETIDPLSNQIPETDNGLHGFAHKSYCSEIAVFGQSPVNTSDVKGYNSSKHESYKQIQHMRPNIIETKGATSTSFKKRECVQSRQQSCVSSGSNESSIVSPGDELEHHLYSSSEVHSTGSAGIPSASSSSSAQSQTVFHFDREFSPPDQVFLDNPIDHSSENVPINYENLTFCHHYHDRHIIENSHHLVNRTLDDNLLGEATGGYDEDDLRGMERRNNLSLGGSSVDSYGSHMSTPSLYLSNFQNDSSNQQEKVFEKLSLEQPFHLACSSDEEENNSHSEQRHGVEEYLRTEENWGFVQCIEGSEEIHVDLTQRFGPYTSAPLCGDASPRKIQMPECIQENSMIVLDEPIYEEIDDMELEMYQAADREDLGISKDNLDSKMCNNVPNKKPQGKFGKGRRRPQQSDIEKVMIWNEYEAYVLQVKQIGTSACGPTAVLNILKAFDFQVDKDEVCQAVVTNTRMEAAPIPYYIFSRSFAGTTSETLLEGIEKLTRGAIKGRFFHFYPPRDVQLLKWLGYWIKKGAVPIATLNLQRGVKPGWTIPDAWHHQMIYGVSSKGVYLTNPLEIVCEEIILEQLSSDSVLLIRRQDIVNRFRDWCPLNEILKQKDPRWRIMNVLGQVANVLRENCSPLNHAAGFRPQLTSHISIPAVYKAGITLFMRSSADAFEELMSVPELPFK
ncbi:hypothetical protein CHS0354_029754 [Potamilus streckersoni]|uniref:Uncharacterized protein n=1 Tax=Potamilus streckersoni TaxID=2493646 RepID=A0AAE0WD42_9BIVA|nr:hypothetical protein CHS0354_029754 [Potamilus streckersoni]